jgi:hypothetical protein
MRKLTRLLLFGLLATAAVAQQGTWTLYYADNETLNQDGSITVTPQVWISGDDGGYCAPLYGMFGYDVPAVLLNGNPWQVGDLTISGGQSGFGDPVQFYYTFPDVTIPNDGTTVDLSYAGKVQGICWGRSDDERSMWAGSIPNIYAFFTANFVDGTAPTTSPGPCFINGFSSPGCALPWPFLYAQIPPGSRHSDLYSESVGQTVAGTPACGTLQISAPKKSETCDGATVYHAAISVTSQNITGITATSWAQNILVLDLIGPPYLEEICPQPQWCVQQDYKAYNQPPRSGTINYVLSITCSAPPDEITVPQAFACK